MKFRAHIPVEIQFGPGKIRTLGEVVRPLGRRAFLVTMPELGHATEAAVEALRGAGVEVVIYDRAKPEPKTDGVAAAITAIREADCDVAIGLGGGSAIDTAKAVALGKLHPEPIWEYVNLSNRPPRPVDAGRVLPAVAVPTTAGTGSEATPYAVITNAATEQKGTIKQPEIFPRVAVVDPELTLTLPRSLTVATGVDALAHAVESYFNVPNRTPFTDLLAEEAIRRLVRHLPGACADGGDLEARSGTLWGATLAGMTIAQAGTTVVHALAQPLGARLGVPHGESVAVFLLAVLKHTLPAEQDRFARLYEMFTGEPSGALPTAEAAGRAIAFLESFLDGIGMRRSLAGFGAREGLADELAEDVSTYMSRPLKQHPKVFDKEELRAIVRDSF